MEDEKYKHFHTSGECAHEHGAKHNSISIFRTFDKSPLHMHVMKVAGDQKAVQMWVDKASLPTLIEFANDFIEPVFKKNLPSLILYTNDKTSAFN